MLELVKEVKERQRGQDPVQLDSAKRPQEEEYHGDVSVQAADPDRSVVILDASNVSASMIEAANRGEPVACQCFSLLRARD